MGGEVEGPGAVSDGDELPAPAVTELDEVGDTFTDVLGAGADEGDDGSGPVPPGLITVYDPAAPGALVVTA